MTLKKKERQNLLKTIIQQKKIGTQSDLIKELARKGVKINQPTISRDLREIGVVKLTKGLGKVVYQIPADNKSVNLDEFRHKFLNLVIDMHFAENLILVKTYPGEAQGVAKVIDNAELPYILGTVAGDDTILIVVDTVIHVRRVLREFEELKKGIKKT
jgi:transcriptional regulator of arginine metabolism